MLEIGCGQGDTSATLDYLVGDAGFVHGIDIAPPSHESPVTLGDSIDFIKKSEIGNRLKSIFPKTLLTSSCFLIALGI